MKNLYIIFILSIININIVSSQCIDGDATIWEDTWASCETSMNPISSYGQSHWIQYNFGSIRTLSKTWVWNSNDPNKLNQGFNQVSIDYSEDGTNWTNWGEMNFPKATGEIIYSGFPGPDMQNVNAQYVLITALSNHGDSNCSGIAEVKFNLMPNLTSERPIPDGEDDDEEDEEEDDDDEEEDEEVACIEITDIIIEEVSFNEAFIFWEINEDEIEDLDELNFIIEYGTDENNLSLIETDEQEILLESLEPGTEYFLTIGVDCDEEPIFSEPISFTTIECNAVTDIEIEIEDPEAYIFWEFEGELDYFLIEISLNDEFEEFETDINEIYIDDIYMYDGFEMIVGVECGEEIIWSDPFQIDLGELDETTSNELLDIANEPQYEVYPNPTQDIINIKVNNFPSQGLRMTIVDTQGRNVKEVDYSNAYTNQQIQMDMSDMESGVYFLNFWNVQSAEVSTHKIVKTGH